MFDVDEVVGCKDGKWCIGIVPFCFETCKPTFIWYKNDGVYGRGENLYYLPDLSLSEKPSTWFCEIQCTAGEKMISEKITLKIGPSEKFDNNLQGVLMKKKDDFMVEKDTPGGMGQQATVYKGTFGKTVVAIKIIKFYSVIPKVTYKEIDVLKSLNHVNFIKLLAVCVEKKRISLLLEYFQGKALSYIIDDEDLHKEYRFKSNKGRLILQLTAAL